MEYLGVLLGKDLESLLYVSKYMHLFKENQAVPRTSHRNP